jgi:hypothetical protein
MTWGRISASANSRAACRIACCSAVSVATMVERILAEPGGEIRALATHRTDAGAARTPLAARMSTPV